MRKTQKFMSMALAGVLLLSGTLNVTAAAVKEVKKPLTRYNEAYNKAYNFNKEVEVTNKEGKKVKQQVETYKIVLPEEVLEIDTAIQEYVQYSMLKRVKDSKAEDLMKPAISLVGVPREYVEYNGSLQDDNKRENMGHMYKEDYFKGKKDLKVEKDYNFFKDISREELEEGLKVASSLVELRRLQIVLSPYKVSGGKEYVVQSTVPRFELKDNVNRQARMVIEPVEGNNILASAWTGLGRVLYTELFVLGDGGMKEYEEIYGAAMTETQTMTHSGRRQDAIEQSFAEDFRIYLTNKTKGKSEVVDKIVAADKDSFYNKETIYGRKDAETKKFFDKKLADLKYKVEPQRLLPEVRVHLKNEGGYLHFWGEEASWNHFNRLYTTTEEIVITGNDEKTQDKIVSIGTIRGIDEFMDYDNLPASTKIKKNAKGEYRIKLAKGITVIEIVTKTKDGYETPVYLDIQR